MRVAIAFVLIVLCGAASTMYVCAWRHGRGLGERALESASAPAPVPDASPAAGDDPAPAPAPAAPAVEVWYQYTDDRGSIRFASSMSEVPVRWHDRVSKVEMSPIRITSLPSRRAAPTRTRSRRSQPVEQVWGGSRSEGEIIVYTTSWCGACRKAIAHLEAKGVDFERKDIEEDPDAHEEYLRKAKGRRGIPLIDVGGQILQGYSPRRLDQLLANLG